VNRSDRRAFRLRSFQSRSIGESHPLKR
jgi:hypothetical protein